MVEYVLSANVLKCSKTLAGGYQSIITFLFQNIYVATFLASLPYYKDNPPNEFKVF